MDPESCKDVCFCCFNKAKNLVKLMNCKHRSFLDHVVVNDIKLLNFSICSLCHVFLVKIESFKQQVVINLEIISDPLQVIDTNRIPKSLDLSDMVATSFSPAVALPIITSVKSCNIQVNDKEVAEKPQLAGPQSSQNCSTNSPLLRLFSGNGHSSEGSSSPNMFPKTGQLVLIANGQNQANNKANATTNPGLFTINTSNANTLFSNNGQLLRVSGGQNQVNNKVNAVTNPGLFTINTSPANQIFTNTGQLLRVSGNGQNQINTANSINPVQLTYPIQIKDNQCTTQSKVAVNLVLSQLNKALQVSSNSGHGRSQSDAGNKKPIYILTSPGQLLPVTDGLQPSSNWTQLPTTYDNQKKGLTDKNLVFEINDSDSDTESDERRNWDDMASLTKAVTAKKKGNNSQESNLAPVESWHARAIHNRYFGKIRAGTLTEEGVEEERARKRESEEYQRLPYRCENCVISYKFEYKLADHIERRHKPKPGAPTCCICKLVLKNTDVFEVHTRSHIKRYDCTVCGKRFNRLKLAITHYNEAHSAEYDDDRRCPNCSYSTRSRSEYLKHKDSHFQYGCKECPEKFDTNGGRQAHLRSVHKKGKFVCKECQKVYYTENGLQIHTLSFHTKDDSESSYCAPCGKQFPNKYYLRTHLRTHVAHVRENCRRFECHDCGQRFLQKWEMKRHIMLHHLNVVRFKCQHCGKAFFTRNLLNRHIRSVHEKRRPPKDKICQYCGRGFPTNAQLTTHTRTHTGERPLQCDLCPATFAQNAARYNHRRLVHKITKPAAK